MAGAADGMSIDRFFVRAVTIVRAGSGTDRYGNESLDWSAASSWVTKGWLARVDESEDQDGRDALISGWRLFLPVGTDVDGRDRVVIDGTTYELDGPPARPWTPDGEHHVECRLRLVEG